MRQALIAAGLGLVALGCGLPGAATAQEVPAGSYLASCQNIRVSAGWLHANCQDRNGRWVESTTVPSWCASGDIANDDGRLTCRQGGGGWGAGWGSGTRSPAPPPVGEQIPRGSYMATCRDVRISAGWLHATCQDRNGRWVSATTAASWCTGRDIRNDNGSLTCR